VETKDGIKSFRDRLRFNQAELAEKLGIVQGNITAWESGRGTPSFQISKKLLELGITVEELFGVKYNEMHYLAVWKVFPEGSGIPTRINQKKLNDFEADLLKEILDEYASLDGKLESVKNLKEVYKLEREIERGDNTTDLAAKKQRLQELQEQIDDKFILSNMFDAKKDIKSLEEDIKQLRDASLFNSFEELKLRECIQDLQQQIKETMYFYVDSELKKLAKQEPINEKVRKCKDQLLDRLREKIKRKAHNSIEQNTIKQRIRVLEEEFERLENGG